jgi:hypothetical protein
MGIYTKEEGQRWGPWKGGGFRLVWNMQGHSICVIEKCKFLHVILKTPILVIIVALLIKSKGKWMEIIIIN